MVKKIGSYLRIKKLKNGPVPEYDLKPNSISIKRKLIEYIIGLVLSLSSKKLTRLFFLYKLKYYGPTFQFIRRRKSLTKTTKEKVYLKSNLAK